MTVPKTALITGASRGIGAAVAKLLAARGYRVAVNYANSKDKAEAVVAEIEQAGGTALAIQADVSKPDDITAMFATIDRELGAVTALVNNAAANPSAAFEDTDPAMLEQVYRTNVFATFLCTQEAVKRMKKAGGGGIVTVSSQAAIFGGNRLTAYASSKAALNTLLIGLAREVAPYNIRVNNISPGIIDTDAHANATPERLEGLKASIPLGRMGTPEEVAAAIAWLLSDEASYISGVVLPVAGAR